MPCCRGILASGQTCYGNVALRTATSGLVQCLRCLRVYTDPEVAFLARMDTSDGRSPRDEPEQKRKKLPDRPTLWPEYK